MKSYGNYFTKGVIKGSSIQIIVKTQKSSDFSSESIGAGLKASWSSIGIGGLGAAASFSKGLNESSEISSSTIEVNMSGHATGKGV